MKSAPFRAIARRLPPIAWRDAKIARLSAQHARLNNRVTRQAVKIEGLTARLAARDRMNTKLQADLTAQREELARRLRPSFRVKYLADDRVRSLARDVHGAGHPIRSLDGKTSGYRFAEGYGIPTPTRIAQCQSSADIDWSELPDNFVIKTEHGTSARGVLVLKRGPDGYVDLLAEDRTLTPDEIVADLDRKAAEDVVSRELVIEELIRSPSGMLLDVKLYCFYGTVGLITVIARDTRRSLRFRHFWPDGTDAGDIRLDRQRDPDLPEPMHLTNLVAAGETLSAALPEPFVRLDFYERADGIVFGEITPRPGGKQIFRPDVDEHLGSLWENAEAKLRAEAVAAGLHDPRLNTGICADSS